MNKGELVKVAAEKAGISQKEMAAGYDAIVETILDALKAGEKIQLVGFGTFEVKDKPARDGINPFSGEKIKIAASKAPSFKFGNSVKDALNK